MRKVFYWSWGENSIHAQRKSSITIQFYLLLSFFKSQAHRLIFNRSNNNAWWCTNVHCCILCAEGSLNDWTILQSTIWIAFTFGVATELLLSWKKSFSGNKVTIGNTYSRYLYVTHTRTDAHTSRQYQIQYLFSTPERCSDQWLTIQIHTINIRRAMEHLKLKNHHKIMRIPQTACHTSVHHKSLSDSIFGIGMEIQDSTRGRKTERNVTLQFFVCSGSVPSCQCSSILCNIFLNLESIVFVSASPNSANRRILPFVNSFHFCLCVSNDGNQTVRQLAVQRVFEMPYGLSFASNTDSPTAMTAKWISSRVLNGENTKKGLKGG